MLFSFGNLEWQSSPGLIEDRHMNRVLMVDFSSKITFLIDIGADISVIPKYFAPYANVQEDLTFTDIRHVSGSDNSVADALSKINALNLSTTDFHHFAYSQNKDDELKTLISSNNLSIKLKPLEMGYALEIFCDVSREKE
ncbi:hypothetical protein TNCV_2428071 [Trichonephila clavipes]|nr:hypothetical protein TNCV_2428071 [Trichonephila clavipes]